ncbi:MAG: UDP-2,4-diacetamido-2,4,6-trideoxy-beta-L-altropyranose hydrolase, partial [Woeseiaceae bacterium]
MNVVFRTDASFAIGAGHLFRCMALAEELVRRGATVLFVCRTLEGHLGDEVRRRGLAVEMLPAQASNPGSDANVDSGDHNLSLEVNWQKDAQETRDVVAALGKKPEWLIVDHYGLDSRWEEQLYGVALRIMVIDDLANRDHNCDLLLDQNLYTDADSRYIDRLPSHCRQLLGPRFTLLRSEFKKRRATLRGRNGEV